jgi:hypothetical protein
MVLPEADSKREAERDEADNQTRAQLIEMLNQVKLVVMADRP